MIEMRVGDRVKVTVEGVVTQITTRGSAYVGQHWIYGGDDTVQVEKLTKPIKFVDGDILQGAPASPVLRSGGKWVWLDSEDLGAPDAESMHGDKFWVEQIQAGTAEILRKADER